MVSLQQWKNGGPEFSGSPCGEVISGKVIGKFSKPSAWGYNWVTLFLREINTGTWPSRLLESQILDSKNMVMSPAGLGPKKDCAGKAQQQF
jgi:hypothetical protein